MAGLSDWFKTPNRGEQLRAAGVREDLVRAVERTPFSRHSDALLTSLPVLLTDDEVVVDLVEGRHERRVGLLVLTGGRVLFVAKASGPTPPVEIARATVVTASAHVHRGMSAVTLTLATGFAGGEFVVDQILGNQAEAFVAHLLLPGAATRPGAQAEAERDPIDELIELRLMYRAGTVSDTEFQLRKKQLFDRI